MLKNNGSWLYCDQCNKTVGYLCYSTYQNFHFDFKCKCENQGSFDLKYETDKKVKRSSNPLLKKKNRLCCPEDESPLFSVVDKNIYQFSYDIICKTCLTSYTNRS